MKLSGSFFAFIISCLLIIGVAIAYPKWNFEHSNATLSWDVTGYYLYLPAHFIYDDLGGLGFKDEIMAKYKPANSFYHAVALDNGNYVMKYSIGLAIQMLPFFLLALLMAKIGGYPIDGFSYPFQFCISWGSILVAFIGLWYIRKILLHYFNEKTTAITILLLAFGTNYLNYTAIDGAMSHNYLFTLYAILIWLTIQWYAKPSFKKSILIGSIIGLMTITRPVEIIATLIPLFWGIGSWSDFKNRFSLWKEHLFKIGLAVIATILVGSIQLMYWKFYSGDFLFYSYEDQGFDWLHPHVKNVLVSFRKGWLVYTPIMTFSLLGFIGLWLKNRRLFWGITIFFAFNYYLIAAWSIWWYGGSFGQRAFVQSYAILSIPLAMFIHKISDSKVWIKGLVMLASLFCIWLNLFQMYQSHKENAPLLSENMTMPYYWRIFGRTAIPDSDKKLLDTDEDYRGVRKNVKEVFQNGFEAYSEGNNITTQNINTGKMAALINKEFPDIPEMYVDASKINSKWIRVKGHFHTQKKEQDMWRMPFLKVDFQKGENSVKSRFIRISRVLPIKEYSEVFIDVSVPEAPFDRVKLEVVHLGSKIDLYVDDIRMETFDEK